MTIIRGTSVPQWKKLRPPAAVLNRTAKTLGRLSPRELLVHVYRTWVQAWPWVPVWALLFSLTASVAKIFPQADDSLFSRILPVVVVLALGAFTETGVMIMAGHVYLGARGGIVVPAKLAFSVFGELFLTEICVVSPLVFGMALLMASGGNNPMVAALLMIPAVYICVRWAVAVPALILEQEGPFKALTHSWILSSERFPFLMISLMGGLSPYILWLFVTRGFAPQLFQSDGLAFPLGLMDGLFATWIPFLVVGIFLGLRGQQQSAANKVEGS